MRVALKFNDLTAPISGKTLQARKRFKPSDGCAKFIKRGLHLLNLARLQRPHDKDTNDCAGFAANKTAIFDFIYRKVKFRPNLAKIVLKFKSKREKMIYLCGDTHGSAELHKIMNKAFLSRNFTREDYVIVLGDFGLFFSDTPNERLARERLGRLSYTLLFIDGNHENFDLLYGLPTEEKFGGKVGVGGENLFWLRRGEIYEIDGRNLLAFGGAFSIDRAWRRLNVSYWDAEIPSQSELNFALSNLARFKSAGGKIDAVLSHTAPTFLMSALSDLFLGGGAIYDPTTDMLERIFELAKPEKWYFGHFHADRKISARGCEFHLCYDEILKF